jgi:hypothetical protein
MPRKFKSCVKKVSLKSPKANAYAVCRVSTRFFGSTRRHK